MPKKRKALSKKTRFDVFKRDGFICLYCGGHPPAVILHCDHIIPVAQGGENDIDNLATACDACNMGKGARSLSAVPQSLSVRAAEVAEREAQIKGYSDIMAAQRERIESDTWQVVDIYTEQYSMTGIRKDLFISARNFVEKLGVHECILAMESAVSKMSRSRDIGFRYFCGICWAKIRELEA